ncbi:cholesterol 7-desaturase nvd-like [Diadema antillarum]|uniref:cholesterol 7-desaturase nvd-like n=1 Tax=Diadema antillarum TaxID=105358 RepID=UPI003A87C32E
MARVCVSKVLPALLLILGLSLAVALAGSTPTSTLSLLKDNLKVVNMPLGDWLEIMITNVVRFVASQTVLTIAVFAVGCYVAKYLYGVFFLPMNIIRRPGDVGYILDGKRKSEVVNEIRRRRKVGQLPPLFPNGWIPLIASCNLKKGDVEYISAFDHEFAVFRGEDGEAHVLDAYCPHLGANIAVGGLVKGNCLMCPFHGWKFEGKEGKCVDIPYKPSDKPIPNVAHSKAWPMLEQNGLVFVWHDAEGREPQWQPESMDCQKWGKMRFHGKTEHTICAHIEEISENGADCNHLEYVHGNLFVSGNDLRYMGTKWLSWARHSWGGTWEQDPDDKHIGIMTIYHSFSLFGIPLMMTQTKSEARQNGPAHVLLYFYLPFGSAVISIGVTPTEGLVQKVTQQVFSTAFVPRWLAKFFLLAEYLQFERDITIWNHKTYLNKPVLVAQDRLIGKHRRWYSQFFSEHTPRFSDQKPTLDW